MSLIKRPLPVDSTLLAKRPRTDLMVHERGKELVEKDVGKYRRTSSLPSPNMMLAGHSGEIFCGKFKPNDGSILITAGHDNQILFWNMEDKCKNLGAVTGHGSAILDLAFSGDGDFIYSASVDKSVMIWDSMTGERVRKCKGHTSFINSVSPVKSNKDLFCSASDDCKIRLWDKRVKNTIHTLDAVYPILTSAYSSNGEFIYSGGIENVISQWDIRENKVVNSYQGHNDTVTGLALSEDGNYLLSNSMDKTLRIWDIRPYVKGDRCWRILTGHQHNYEKNLLRCAWSMDGRRVTCGSSDRHVMVWDVYTGNMLYRLPGHTGSVNETGFHPKEPILMSVSSDMKIIVGEIQAF